MVAKRINILEEKDLCLIRIVDEKRVFRCTTARFWEIEPFHLLFEFRCLIFCGAELWCDPIYRKTPYRKIPVLRLVIAMDTVDADFKFPELGDPDFLISGVPYKLWYKSWRCDSEDTSGNWLIRIMSCQIRLLPVLGIEQDIPCDVLFRDYRARMH